MEKFKVVIVEDVKLELKGTEEIFRHEIPNAEVIGTAMTEEEFWKLMETCTPDMVLLDLGLGGSTTIGVEICARLHRERPELKVLIFTGEILNEKLWVDALAGWGSRHHLEDRRTVDCDRCAGRYGWKEDGVQRADTGKDCSPFHADGGSGTASSGGNYRL